MTDKESQLDEPTFENLEELSDEEFAETYKSVMKNAPVVKTSLLNLVSKPEQLELIGEVDERTMRKAEENAEEAQEDLDWLDSIVDSVREELERRDIDPYEF